MNFTTFCDNKGCRAEMQPVVDKESMVAYCTVCGEPINSVSDFMKRQMISFGMVRKLNKKKSAFSVTCSSCGKSAPPELKTEEKDGNTREFLTCPHCNHELDQIAKPFAEMLKTNLRAQKRSGK
jgi:ribosomal protein L34E